MSHSVERALDGPGEDEYVEAAWALKERVRETDGVLKQRRGFFVRAYRRATAFLFLVNDDLAGFAAARDSGYLLFLAVAPEHRNEGLGERLVGAVAEEFGTVTCHARASNEGALAFYEAVGFERVRKVPGYYEDGGDAYYLRLGEDASLRQRLSEWLGR
ncbi:MAG: GNAT family N-acetyltransferase [Halobacteriaceae archaeon]